MDPVVIVIGAVAVAVLGLAAVIAFSHRDTVQALGHMDQAIDRMDRTATAAEHAADGAREAAVGAREAARGANLAAQACMAMVREFAQWRQAQEKPGPAE
jgi:hypothetical protein